MTVTFDALDASGAPVRGLTDVAFGLASDSTGAGTFGPVAENPDGSYSAVFSPTVAGLVRFTATTGALLLTDALTVTIAAPAPAPFTWTGGSPKWNNAGGGQVTLASAQGVLQYPADPPVTDVVFLVYTQGTVPGSWNATPTIRNPLQQAPTFDKAVGGWSLAATDNTTPAAKFTAGQPVKIVWQITTSKNGVTSTTTVELVVTPQAPAN